MFSQYYLIVLIVLINLMLEDVFKNFSSIFNIYSLSNNNAYSLLRITYPFKVSHSNQSYIIKVTTVLNIEDTYSYSSKVLSYPSKILLRLSGILSCHQLYCSVIFIFMFLYWVLDFYYWCYLIKYYPNYFIY